MLTIDRIALNDALTAFLASAGLTVTDEALNEATHAAADALESPLLNAR